jgi:hypothetical protein
VEEPFLLPQLPGDPGDDGWTEEVLEYTIRPRPKAKFKTILDAHRLFTSGEPGVATLTTRTRPPVDGEDDRVVLDLTIEITIGKIHQVDHMQCTWRGGMISHRLMRVVGESRKKEINFHADPHPFPPTTYPEVLLPFLMRGQPRDDKRRALYAWTSDRFVARVYYETRGGVTLDVPAGQIESTEVWMYPDLNDWVAIGRVLTRLAKPLLPRYEMFFENEPPYRVVKFEGSFGPPGAPEMIIELS